MPGGPLAVIGIEMRRAGAGCTGVFLRTALGERPTEVDATPFYGERPVDLIHVASRRNLRVGLAQCEPTGNTATGNTATGDAGVVAQWRAGTGGSDAAGALEWAGAGLAGGSFDIAIVTATMLEETEAAVEIAVAVASAATAGAAGMAILALWSATGDESPTALIATAGRNRREIEGGLQGALPSQSSALLYRSLWIADEVTRDGGGGGAVATLQAIALAVLAIACRRIPPSREIDGWAGPIELGFGQFLRQRPWLHEPGGPARHALVMLPSGGGLDRLWIVDAEADGPDPVQLPWTAQVFVLSGADRDGLRSEIEGLARRLAENPVCMPADLAAELWARPHLGHRCAIVASGISDLANKLALAIKRLMAAARPVVHPREQILFGQSQFADTPVAFTVPGLGSPYPGMLRELACVFPHARRLLERLPALTFHGEPLLSHFYPADNIAGMAAQESVDRFWSRVSSGSGAGCLASQAMFDILRAFHIEPALLVGHSIGESAALALGEGLGPQAPENVPALVAAIAEIERDIFTQMTPAPSAAIAVACADRAILDRALQAHAGEVFVALDNCPHQTVLAGVAQAIETVAADLSTQGINCVAMSFPFPLHTPLLRPALELLDEFYSRLGIQAPRLPTWSGAANAPFPDDAAAIKELVVRPWTNTVHFIDTTQAVHDRGIRVFIELGPGETLSGFTDDILKACDHLAVSCDSRWFGGLDHLLAGLGRLYTAGVAFGPVRQVAQDTVAGSPRTSGPAESGRHMPSPAGLAVGSPGGATILKGHFALMNEFIDQQTRVLARTLTAARGQALQRRPPRDTSSGDDLFSDAVKFPALGPSVSAGDGKVTFERRLTKERDPYLLHHVFGRIAPIEPGDHPGLPVVPFVATLETMAQAALAAMGPKAGPWVVAGIERIRLHRWLTLDRGHLDLRIVAHAADAPIQQSDSERQFFNVEIFELDKVAPSGRWLAADSIVELARKYDIAPSPTVLSGKAIRPGESVERFEHRSIFQGSSFKSRPRFLRVTDQGIEAEIVAPPRDRLYQGQASPRLATGFNALDATGQVFIRWVVEYWEHHYGIYPSTVDRFRQYGPPPQPGDLLGCTAVARLDGMVAAADFEIRRSDGSVLYRYSGFKHRRFDWTAELHACLYPPKWDFAPSFSRPFDTYSLGILGCRVDASYFGFLDKNQAIFLQAVAHCVLTVRERLIWRDLPAAGPRRPLWLIGRIAAKEVVQRWARERHGTVLHRLAIEIRTDERGKPFASVDRGILETAVPDLSISHSGGAAVAIIAELADSAVGIDMEVFPAGVVPAAPERAFTQDEIDLATERSIALIDLWCAKEAAAKALGLGLLGEPRRWRVHAIGTSNDRMAVSFASLSVPVTLFRLGDAGVAIAHGTSAMAAAAQRSAESELAPQI